MNMEHHEYADLFPMMNADELNALIEDMRANGFDATSPIITFQNKILDGRNRFMAALEAKVKPIFQAFTGNDALGFVVRHNLKRRHLSSGQRAAIATEADELVERLKEEAKERQEATQFGYGAGINSGTVTGRVDEPSGINSPTLTGEVNEQLASMFDTNAKYVQHAKKLKEEAPDLYEDVKDGKTTIQRAMTVNKKRRQKEDVRAYSATVASLPSLKKTFNVIYADPPWEYSKSTNTLDAVTDHHYTTLPIEKICSFMNDQGIRTADNAVLFLWVTNPFLEKALQVVKAWGFTYKTNIAWMKKDLKRPGVGYYVRGRHELLFICTKGSFTPLTNPSPPIGSVLEASIGKHSQKPEEVYDIIESLYPDCVYLELFARNKRDGWEAIGNEA